MVGGIILIYTRAFQIGDRIQMGLANWLQMFTRSWLSPLSKSEQAQVIQEVEKKLRSKLYQEGGWIADYRRIRLIAYQR